MTKTRALAWIVPAALGAMLGLAAPAAAQGYDGQRGGYGQRGDVYGAPPAWRPHQVAPPVRVRPRAVDPYYGNAPSVRKYGHGPSRHWRRWAGRPHPAWRDSRDDWQRPRYFDDR